MSAERKYPAGLARAPRAGSILACLLGALAAALVVLLLLYFRSRAELTGERRRAAELVESHLASRTAGAEQPEASPVAPAPPPAVPGAFLKGVDAPGRPVPPSRLDALARWRDMDAVAPADPSAPDWVRDAAGSEPWSQEVLGAAVAGRRPGSRGEIVGYSPALEAVPEKARAAALRSAIEGLRSIALWQVTGWKDREGGLVTDGGRFLSVAGVSAFLEGLFERDLHPLVRGWYDQKVLIHGEPMYRSAVLVRADEKKAAEVLREAARTGQLEAFARRREILWTAASALGLALVIFLLYALLNAGTKGHFAWPLRLVSIGALATTYLVLLYAKGWFP